MNHQSNTVAAEAQLPGPGRMRPHSKKVAITQESLPAFGRAVGAVFSVLVLSTGIIEVYAVAGPRLPLSHSSGMIPGFPVRPEDLI